MRPRLHPSLARVWRDVSTFQLGITPGHAVLLGGLRPEDVAVVRAMDGGRTVAELREIAVAAGGQPTAVDHLIDTLVTSNAIVDDAVCGESLRRPDPDAATAALLSDAPDAGVATMATRSRSRVVVRGAGRVGSVAARLLAASGVGSVDIQDTEPTSESDLSPGGLDAEAVGLPRDRATRTRIASASSSANSSPDLVVLTPPNGPLPDTAGHLLRSGTPHLAAQVIETTGSVGPLVVPGESPCLRCVELHRTGHDPMWPLVVGQSAHRPPPAPACDVALATMAAALATSHAVSYLDGHTPASVGGTIEITLPACQPRRRSWPVHPACGCSWDGEP